MKNILILSTSDINGAYEASYKIGLIIKEMGHNVKMLVKNKTKLDEFIVEYPFPKKRIRTILTESLISVFSKKNYLITDPNYGYFSTDENSTNTIPQKIIDTIGFVPDYIFSGMTIKFMNTSDIYNLQKLSKAKVYNITVDMNHFTGGCHFAWDCKGYIHGCDSHCPAIINDNKKLAEINFNKKQENAKKGNFQILAGSGWTLQQAQQSKIYKNQKVIENINSLIDIQIFNNNNREIAKQVFSLDKDKFYILSGAQNSQDKRKGFEYLIKSLKYLEQILDENTKKKIEILIISRHISSDFDKINFNKKKIDYINDYRLLALLYQATDLYVNTSIEDSGPMMVSEALACGTPVAGFDMGIVNNMIINDYNGYKAKLKDSEDLAIGIKKILNLSTEQSKKYSDNAVKQVEKNSSYEYAKKIFSRIIT